VSWRWLAGLLIALSTSCARREDGAHAGEASASSAASAMKSVDFGPLRCSTGVGSMGKCQGDFPMTCTWERGDGAYDEEPLRRFVWIDPAHEGLPTKPRPDARCFASGPHKTFNPMNWCCRKAE
jgi:hypothetical protein